MTKRTVQDYVKAADAFKTSTYKMLESQGKGWEEMFIPADAFTTGSREVIDAADASKDQTPAGRQKAAWTVLRNTINSTGHGDQVSNADVTNAVTAILKVIT